MIVYQCYNQLNNRLYAFSRTDSCGINVYMYDVTDNEYLFRKQFYLQNEHIDNLHKSIKGRYHTICAISPSARQCTHVNSILEV